MTTTFEDTVRGAIEAAWRSLHGDPNRLESVRLQHPERTLPSIYEVSALAAASVGVATLAVAEWVERIGGAKPPPVHVDVRHASLAFLCERWLSPIGWELPGPWDPLAGDYRVRDGFVRLHTNYVHHRDAVLRTLEVPAEREAVARAVAERSGEEVEAAIVAAGGCAANMRSEVAWAAHPAGRAIAAEPLVAFEPSFDGLTGRPLEAAAHHARSAGRPLAGLRVLDLTRVIAGPIATRQLAAYGADVLRIDPPGFEEVPALLPETTAGKRCAALDLRRPADRARFEALLVGADALVCGLRADALARLGFDRERLAALNPSLVVARLDAYGFDGPYRDRRGFDSLVQMSAGIAERGMRARSAETPVPLPAQALDHGTGYLLAAAIVRAAIHRALTGQVREVRLSLARTALYLQSLGVSENAAGQPLAAADAEPYLEQADTAWGPVRRVRVPGAAGDIRPRLEVPAAPLGTAAAEWGA